MHPRTLMHAALLLVLLFAETRAAHSQNPAPVVSGGVGFVATRNGDNTFLQPVIAPVGLLPIGDRVLIESRFDFRQFWFHPPGGDFNGSFFSSVEYLQADLILAPQATLVVGRFLTPFNTFNERYTPFWIRNFQDAPIIFPMGTRTQGSSNGAMLRGVAARGEKWQLNYLGFFSALSTVNKFRSGRAAGTRIGLYFPDARVEVGGSYERFLQDTRHNIFGAFIDWKPSDTSDLRGELAHSPSGTGYWIEGAYRFGQAGQTGIAGLQLVGRVQQFYRDQFLPGDSMPGLDTHQTEFGVNYYLPQEVRLSASYGRRFNAVRDINIWNFAVTYRFLLPIAGGGQ
ncbi:MAG: hypothetical protein AB7O65_04230 [Candidatus Korobacteraceae bacterium]